MHVVHVRVRTVWCLGRECVGERTREKEKEIEGKAGVYE